ncbi:MAG TPA: hypothetical protein VGD37_17155 [Kofleriaceae bacterium]|jgi:DNA anti-recombination protein RmuC
MNTLDMSAPVTRGELRAELAQLDQKFDQKLEFWGGALLARITESERQAQARITESEQRLQARITESEQRLLTELGRHTRAIQETMTAQISVIDEKYADLPARVRRLEAKASALRRR